MALPKLVHPTFTLELPSNKQKIKFRPFTVKEEKIILVAQSTDDFDTKIDAIKQLVNNCVEDKDFDVDNITIFDLEYFFINIRAKSVNNILTIVVDDADGKKYNVDLDLNDVKVTYPESDNFKIELTPEVGVIMKYPAYKITKDIEKIIHNAQKADDYVDAAIKIFASCIDKVYDNESVYIADKDFTQEQAIEFISNISTSVFEKFEIFFKNVPQTVISGKYKNAAGEEKTIEIRNISDFFT